MELISTVSKMASVEHFAFYHPRSIFLGSVLASLQRSLTLILLVAMLIGCGDTTESSDPANLQAELTALAEAGDAEAQYSLAVAQARGEFGEPDPEAFQYWLRRAADNDHPRAQEQLGQLLLAEESPEADAQALDWFQRAVTGGSARASYSLGVMYASGRGVAADLPEAYLWFSLAARWGHERAAEAKEQIAIALSEEQRQAAEVRLAEVLSEN